MEAIFKCGNKKRKECEHDVVLANGFHCAGSVRDFLV
jgi:hypothetical protein